METITYLIAPGANALEIPLLAFPTESQARDFLANIGAVAGRKVSTGIGKNAWGEDREYFETIPDLSPAAHEATVFPFVRVPDDFAPCFTTETSGQFPGIALLEVVMDSDDERMRKALCINGHYYSGCGGMYVLELRTLPVGAPVVAWDLD